MMAQRATTTADRRRVHKRPEALPRGRLPPAPSQRRPARFASLPPRQRAALLLRDVRAFPAAGGAEILGTTTTAVKSALQRARARLEEVTPAADRVAEPPEPEARALLDQYIRAFET